MLIDFSDLRQLKLKVDIFERQVKQPILPCVLRF